MTLEFEKTLDDVTRQILSALQIDARISYTELGKRVGLSAPAVAERIRRLEETGVITGYSTEINLEKIGLAVTAFIRLSVPAELYPDFYEFLKTLSVIIECHHVAGSDSFIMKAMLPSISELETLIARLSNFGQTNTSIVLSSTIKKPFPDLDALSGSKK